jgi:ATP-dependent helicase/nuclease subunit A
MEVSSLESVKIMSIHKSKGLEFPICYFADFQREFNLMDLNNRISYSNKYGIILPTYNNYVFRDTIIKSLYKNYELKEEISEKIRLLYVALTRSKEKLIIVSPKTEV